MASTISAGTTSSTALVCTADTTGALQLATNNGTVAVTVDTSQNVGIGTASPSYNLHVKNGSGNCLIAAQYGTGTIGLLTAGSNTVDLKAFNGTNDVLTFTTGASERMRIDSSGNVTAGGTTSYGKITSAASSGYCFGTDSVGNGADHFKFTTGGGTTTGSITRVGGTGVAYNVTSDQRLKENIQDADSASALVAALQVRKFDWKADNSHQKFGFVAQELLTIAPEAVHQPSDTEEMMGVDYSKLVPMLVKAIQELTAKVAALEAQVGTSA